MKRKNYVQRLGETLRDVHAHPTISARSNDEINQQIQEINQALRGPLSNAERIIFVAERRELRNILITRNSEVR